jgi:hypothetical protein
MMSERTLTFTLERTIPAPASEVFDAWLDPRVPGTPWNVAEKFIVDGKVDGLFYWTFKATSTTGDSPSSSARVECSTLGCRRTRLAKNRRSP